MYIYSFFTQIFSIIFKIYSLKLENLTAQEIEALKVKRFEAREENWKNLFDVSFVMRFTFLLIFNINLINLMR